MSWVGRASCWLIKTAGYHQHIFRLPILVKMPFKRWKRFFFKILCFFIIFSNFSNFETFLIFSRKTLQLWWKRHFQEIIPFDTHSTKNFPNLAILKNYRPFMEKTYVFSQETPKLNVLRNPTILGAFYSKNVLEFGEKKLSFIKVNEHRERNWQTSGKKKRSIWEDFPSQFYKYGRKY